jgi:asparagine synthase (glutamine-hydrolysing)
VPVISDSPSTSILGASITQRSLAIGIDVDCEGYKNAPKAVELPNRCLVLGVARLDNRYELSTDILQTTTHNGDYCDIELISQAYLLWGDKCVEHLDGDWSFAAWNPNSRQLFLARDRFGISSLYFSIGPDYVAFATSRRPLLILNNGSAKVNDLHLAHLLLSWKISGGTQTPHQGIYRLPPAHSLTVKACGSSTMRCYWQFGEAVETQLTNTIYEAVNGVRSRFEQAVQRRVQHGEIIGASLSGGLDSGAVTHAATRNLPDGNPFIHAYTAVPLLRGQDPYTVSWFGHEWQLASLIAQRSTNLIHRPVRSTTTSPLEGIREALWIHDGPIHAASNTYWMHDLLRAAKADGRDVLLTGQTGNLGMSWTGELPRHGRPRLIHWLRKVTPLRLARPILRERLAQSVRGNKNTALHPDLAIRTNVLDALFDDPYHPLHPPPKDTLTRRLLMLGAGHTMIGNLLAEQAAAFRLQIRDPMADISLLTFCLGIPAHLFVDTNAKMGRIIMRNAMIGTLPEEVRLNRRRGLQAADIIPRLRRDRDAMEACLDELERGNAIYYVNLPRLRQVWGQVLTRDDWETHTAAKAVLLRGIMVGLFVQNPAGGPRPNLERPLPAADWELP